MSGEPSAQDEAARLQCLPSLIKLIALAKAELRRSARGTGVLGTEPELLPNLLLAVSAVVRGREHLGKELRAVGGIETLLSLLDLRQGDDANPTEVHVLALEALHAAGENKPERAAHLLELTRTGGVDAARSAAVTVRTVRALGRLAAPLTLLRPAEAQAGGA